VANGRLLVVEDAQFEVGSLGAQFVERGGQVGKLGTGSGLVHRYAPQSTRITPFGGVWVLGVEVSHAGVVSMKFFEKQQQIPFGFAQGRLSTHHPQAEKRLGPRSLRMTALS
jgi:hypothetical protein